MFLSELEPALLKIERNEFGDKIYRPVEALQEAQGVRFLCPICFRKNGGSVGTHAVVCWSENRGVPNTEPPKPGRWELRGTGLHDLTLDGENGKSRSVQILSGCKAHFFVTGGQIDIA